MDDRFHGTAWDTIESTSACCWTCCGRRLAAVLSLLCAFIGSEVRLSRISALGLRMYLVLACDGCDCMWISPIIVVCGEAPDIWRGTRYSPLTDLEMRWIHALIRPLYFTLSMLHCCTTAPWSDITPCRWVQCVGDSQLSRCCGTSQKPSNVCLILIHNDHTGGLEYLYTQS